jgi:hypothetical protein
VLARTIKGHLITSADLEFGDQLAASYLLDRVMVKLRRTSALNTAESVTSNSVENDFVSIPSRK